MTSIITTCVKCGGRGYTFDRGKSVRCECVLEASRRAEYRRSGLPEVCCGTDYLESKSSIAAAKFFGKISICNSHELVWVHVAHLQTRIDCAAYAIRKAIDAGHKAGYRLVDDGVNSIFKPNEPESERWNIDVRNAHALAIVVNDDTASKFVPQVIADVLIKRSSRACLTIIATRDDIREMPAKYGATLAARVKALPSSRVLRDKAALQSIHRLGGRP